VVQNERVGENDILVHILAKNPKILAWPNVVIGRFKPFHFGATQVARHIGPILDQYWATNANSGPIYLATWVLCGCICGKWSDGLGLGLGSGSWIWLMLGLTLD